MRDYEMIDNPQHWPIWPILPLKRRTGTWGQKNSLGYLLDVGPMPVYYVYVGIMYLPPSELKIYNTLDELLDVWKVD